MSGSIQSELPRLDDVNQCIWWGKRRVDLSAKAFQVLGHLVQRPDQMVTKAELLDAVWPQAHVVEAVLTVAISQLREALDDDVRQPRFIETIHRRGYRWIGAMGAEVRGPGAAPRLDAEPGDLGRLMVVREDAVAIHLRRRRSLIAMRMATAIAQIRN